MTTRKTLQREPTPLNRTIFAQGLDGILRAGGNVATRGRREGRDAILIEFHQCQQRQGEEPLTQLSRLAPEFVVRHC